MFIKPTYFLFTAFTSALFFLPETDRVTRLSEVTPVTVAAKSCVLPFSTLAVYGYTVTERMVLLVCNCYRFRATFAPLLD